MNSYSIDLQQLKRVIEKQKPKTVLLQLPDGLKPKALQIVDFIKSFHDCDIYIWAGSCFGACDLPIAYCKQLNIDLIIHFGHFPFKTEI